MTLATRTNGFARSMIRRAALAVAAIATLSAASVQLGAQEARLLAIQDDATRSMVRDFIEAARARGTPTEPLVSRALEGVAFRATAKRIEQAMVALEERIGRSRELLAPRATVDELAAAADALANGVPASAIRDLRKIAPYRQITVEIGVLTELVAKGVAPKKAAVMVRDLMARGATGTQLTELNAAVQQDVAFGVTPVAALELRGRGVMSLLSPSASVNAAIRP
ncbi:MAG: hypothetical protein O2973_00580 [Gemmatimonadetes bacterium]|nr:hypothetical protein [Gemmatimonadota bacterium]